MSDLFLEGLGRPLVVLSEVLELEDRRLERVEVKTRLVEEDISLLVILGLRMPYSPLSEDILVL